MNYILIYLFKTNKKNMKNQSNPKNRPQIKQNVQIRIDEQRTVNCQVPPD